MKEFGKDVKCPEWFAGSTPAEEKVISAGVVRVYESTLRTARNTILNHGTLKTWHGMLFRGAVPLDYYAGNFRGTDARRPCLHYGVKVGALAGEEPEMVEQRMHEFSEALRFNDFELQNHLLNESRPHFQTLAKIGLVAWAMATFIKVHPFANGNGRIARLLVNHLCYRYELPMPFRHPSKRPLQKGYAEAGRSAMLGDFDPTFEYLLEILQDQIGSY